MSDSPSHFTPEELARWRFGLAQANLNNILCHCRDCDETWMASDDENLVCPCGSRRVEHIACWQFPDG
ncbi:hypothetical protein [Leptolyngbya sp. KIOST-1]|uniref:hypothetical protein n=1 Tax=Leptolyngbya sp. KIOST-1 TaxID=1229172 RepID=UPI000560EE5A|nr:hypothetical protein [Leptolyngbya sp. KIOST-1]